MMSFMKLPPEVRCIIYSCVLTKQTPIVIRRYLSCHVPPSMNGRLVRLESGNGRADHNDESDNANKEAYHQLQKIGWTCEYPLGVRAGI